MKDSSNPSSEAAPTTIGNKHEWRNLEDGKRPTYADIKKKFKAEFVERRMGAGFMLSDLVAGQLSVEQEEKMRFEKRVNDELDARLSLIRSEAMQKGLAQGIEEGTKKAYEEERARLAALMENLTSAVHDLATSKLNLTESYENVLSDLSFRIAEAIIHQQIQDKPDVVKSSIRAVLDRVAREEDVRIRLNAHSFEAIESIKEDLKSSVRDGRLHFELDSNLPMGACVVESQSGEYASFVEEKIRILKEAIFGKNKIDNPIEETKVG